MIESRETAYNLAVLRPYDGRGGPTPGPSPQGEGSAADAFESASLLERFALRPAHFIRFETESACVCGETRTRA